MLGVRLVEAFAIAQRSFGGSLFGCGGEPVDGYGAKASRKLHPLGGEHAPIFLAEKVRGPGRPGVWSIRNETWLVLDDR